VKSRALASAALAGLVILGATGCQAITPQATTIDYSPSDGVNIPDTEGAPLQIRNALIVTDGAGERGNLAAAIVNSSDADETLTLDWGDETATVQVPAGSVVSLGSDDVDPLLLESIDTIAGATLPVYFQSGQAEGVLTEVPVLDGCLAHLEALVPGRAIVDCEKPEPASAH
jgi:hypothetical protein